MENNTVAPTDYDILRERLLEILPLLDGLETGQDCEDYAFATGNGFQAMTYCPSAFEALRCIPEAAKAITQLQAKVERLEDALEPSGETKAAYHGEFSFTIMDPVFDEGDETFTECPRQVYVPWTTVKEIMAAIRAYAARQALSDKVGE